MIMSFLKKLSIVFALITSVVSQAAEKPLNLEWRWIYCQTNFQSDQSVEKIMSLLRRGTAAGYNGLMFGDYKLGKPQNRPAHYYENIKKVKTLADELGMELIPMVVPVGWSTEILQNNPHLAEGVPVKESVFKVSGKKAVVANSSNLLPNSGFEKDQPGKRPKGWSWTDDSVNVVDAGASEGNKCVQLTNFAGKNSRLSMKLNLKPYHQYMVSFKVKSKGFRGAFRSIALDNGRNLVGPELHLNSDSEWHTVEFYFNTSSNPVVQFYLGVWGGQNGSIWLDDIQLKESHGINVLRRSGCPLTVTSEDGKIVYEEGRDFEKWVYPKMGNDPYMGAYKNFHPSFPVKLTANSRIKDGQKLKVSYYNAVLTMQGQVACCLTEPELMKYFKDQIQFVKDTFKPKKYMLSYDEHRVAGQCHSCTKDGLTAGQLLGRHVKEICNYINSADPKAKLLTWNDMFDPHHNAKDNYYLVGSTLEKSWEGLPSSVGVISWYYEKRNESYKFFGDRGHDQLFGGYYDDPNFKQRLANWVKASKGAANVRGFMYCTWGANGYKDLEAYMAELKKLLKE